MNLTEIQTEISSAIKSGDKVRALVLRGLLSEIKNLEIDLKAKGEDLTDELTLSVLLREAKKRRESIAAYKTGKRDDLAEAEEQELKILESYLPTQMTEDEIKQTVREIIASAGANAQFGQIMQQTMAKLKGKADGAKVSQVVKELL